MRGERRNDPADRAIGALADRQHGVITRAQLSELGLGRRAIDHRLEVGRLRGVHRGVYTVVGHRLLTTHGRWMAAVLACGPGAVLSHRAAAALWGIRGGTRVEVTAAGSKRRPGMKLHRANLPADETTTHQGIPTTTVPRTLLDLSAVIQRHELRSALRQAEQLALRDRLWLGDLVERYPRKRGTPAIKALIEEAQLGLGVVRSELEERFQSLLISAAVPRPETNARVEGMEVDCAWREQELIVELDGHASHAGAQAFETDRARDRRL